MSKTVIVIIFFTILFSCKSDISTNPLEGYYYAINSAEIYHFKKNKVFQYNFLDSISKTYEFNLDSIYLQLGENKFEYEINNDSILVFDYQQEKNMILKKFEFKDFDIIDLLGTEWRMINTKEDDENITGFLKFHDEKTIYSYFKTNKDNWATQYYSHYQVGKVFNKFYVFSSGMPYIIAGYNKGEMLHLVIDEKYKFHEFKLEQISYKNIDSNIVGNWIKLKDTLRKNEMVYYSYIIDKPGVSLDSIKNEYGYDSVEFTKNNFFINYVKKENKVKKNKIRLDYDLQTNLIFLDSVKYENNYLKVEFLSKDTLRIQFPEPDLLFTYVRRKDKRTD